MSIGKRTRGASEGAETPQELLEPHNVVSVVVAAVRPNAATTWGMIGGCKVEMMLDSGSSISLIQESIAAALPMEHKMMPSGLKLVSASGDNIPMLGCMTLPLCISELQTTHPLLVVQSLIAPVILGLDFLQKHQVVLDFSFHPIKFSSPTHKPDYSENIEHVLDTARRVTDKVCAVNVLTDTTEDTIDNCAVPLFGEKPLQYDIPVCNASAFAPLINHKYLFRTCPGKTTMAEHFIPTTGTPVKIPPRRIPANYHTKVEHQIQTMLQEGIIEECSSPWMAPAVFVREISEYVLTIKSSIREPQRMHTHYPVLMRYRTDCQDL